MSSNERGFRVNRQRRSRYRPPAATPTGTSDQTTPDTDDTRVSDDDGWKVTRQGLEEPAVEAQRRQSCSGG